jgi:hypothetical protein
LEAYDADHTPMNKMTAEWICAYVQTVECRAVSVRVSKGLVTSMDNYAEVQAAIVRFLGYVHMSMQSNGSNVDTDYRWPFVTEYDIRRETREDNVLDLLVDAGCDKDIVKDIFEFRTGLDDEDGSEANSASDSELAATPDIPRVRRHSE